MSVCPTEITRPRHMDNAIRTIPSCNADSPAHGICGKINNRLAHPPGTAVRSKARGVFLNDAERLTRRERPYAQRSRLGLSSPARISIHVMRVALLAVLL